MDIVVDKSATYDSLKDRVVVITGAGQGIGRGFAHHFAAQGAVPVIADIDGGNAAEVQAEIEAKGGRALGMATDVASESASRAMAEAALAAFGRIDVLINNAAVFLQDHHGAVLGVAGRRVEERDGRQHHRRLPVRPRGGAGDARRRLGRGSSTSPRAR